MTIIQQNLAAVESNIRQACLRSGRKREEVTLIAVSKTKPVSMIEEAAAEGIREFGENKPQELRDKTKVLPENFHWHMIGHLQRNKVKYVVGSACLIHSIDTIELAEAVDAQARARGILMPVLIEVNMAGEESKFGLHPEDTEAFIRQISGLSALQIRGLMTIAPFTSDPESSRPYFRGLRDLSLDIASKNIDNVNMCELSMGMTGDYEVAIEEGATLVRVGTGIFGERNYQV